MKSSALIVDDENDIGRLLSAILSKNEIVPLYVDGIAKAKEVLVTNDFDFCFLDVKMPDGSGYDLLQWIDLSTSTTIMISAFDSEEEVKHAKSLGVEYFIGKPFSQKEILSIVL